MSKKGSSDDIGKLTIQLDDLYKSNPTLDHIKRLEEDRKALLGVADLSASWGETSIQDRVEDMRVSLGYPELQDAFKSYEDYRAVISPLISALEQDNAKSLLDAFKIDTEPYLDPTYAQTLRATDLFSKSLVNASQLGLPQTTSYVEDMKKAMSFYEDNFGLGNKKLVELATSFENDAFKSKFALTGNMGSVSEALKSSTSALDSVSLQAAKALEAFQPVKSPWLDKLSKTQETFKMITESAIPKYELPEIPHYEPPRPESSPHYKQNEKILKNSKEQIVLLNRVSVHMSSQTEKLEFLNDITVKQAEDNKIIADKQMEENKIAAKEEMAINTKVSKSAMNVTISSIFISIVFALGSIALTYYVFVQEDISDNKDHTEVVQLLKANNLNGSISELVEQLKIKNQNDIELDRVKKENEKIKTLFEAKND